MTEKLYEELDNAKAEIEKLRSEYHEKSNLCNSLKRSHDDQIKRIQELNLKLERQSQEVEAKTDEIYSANQSLKDLECKLRDKENIIKSFTSANDKLRADFNLKLEESEEEKRNLLCSLDESNLKISDLEQKSLDLMDKIEVLKEGIVSVSQKKCASESKVAKASKQMRERGDMFEKLEEEKEKLEEHIKWKSEQFKHLEEAHEKLRDRLRTKEKEWDMEKSSFFDEISTLETKLDSQITLSEDLQRRLETSNQALAHEQNQRKSQIQEASNSASVAKLQKKLTTLEQIHNECSSQMEVKEAEWRSRIEKMVADLNSCRQELEKKDTRLKEITKELDDCNSIMLQLTMEKEESAVMIAELNSCRQELEKKDTRLKEITKELDDCNSIMLQLTTEKEESAVMIADLNSCRQELEKKDMRLKEITKELDDYNSIMLQLTMEKEASAVMISDLNSCKQELEKKDTRVKELAKELDDYNSIMLQLTMEKEESAVMMVALKSTLLESRLKIHDLVKFQESMKEQHTEMDTLEMIEKEKIQLQKEMKKVCDLLDMANEELADRCCEVNEIEFELQIWKSIAENLQANLEVSHRMRHEVEASLLAQVAIEVNLKEENEEKDERIKDLEQKLEESKKNSDTLLRFSKENGEKLEKEIEWWEKEWVAKELEAAILAQLESERAHEYEKQTLNQILKEKDQRINNLQKIMKSLEEEFDHSSASFSSQLSKMQSDINLFHEAWEKIRTTVVMKEIEVELRDLMIVEMEKDLEKILLEKEKLMEIIGGVSERINKLSREDGQMMGTLRSIVMSFDEKDHFDPVKENTNVFQSPKRRNTVESSHDRRSPLRALNS